MKLTAKWLILFLAISVYSVFMAVTLAYGSFKKVFIDGLKQEIIELVSMKSTDLTQSLVSKPRAISMQEYDIMKWLENDKRILSVLYLNANNTIRYEQNGDNLGKDYRDYVTKHGELTDAVIISYDTKNPHAIRVPKMPILEIAIPFTATGDTLIGVLRLQVSTEQADKNVRDAMVKLFIFGMVTFIIFIGASTIFLRVVIITPLNTLRESMETVSPKNFEIKFPPRNDEIGILASSISSFLAKVRQEMNIIHEKERQRQMSEQSWWQYILYATVSKYSKALVMDEDNTVLFSNFNLNTQSRKVHLLDVVGTQQQEVLRFIGMGMDSPGQLIEGDAEFMGLMCSVRVMVLQTDTTLKRTIVVFEPK